MRLFEWTDSTPDYEREKRNAYRRYSGFCEATQTQIALERDTTPDWDALRLDPASTAKLWRWLVAIPHQTGSFYLPGGDLPDDEARRQAPVHLANVLRKLLEALS